MSTTTRTALPVHLSTTTEQIGQIGMVVDLSERFPVAPTRAIRRPRVAKHEPRLTDGLVHPVTISRKSA